MIGLHQGDCLNLMGGIAAGSVDLILCDLPYGTTACKWDTIIPFEPLWAHYKRIIKPRGAIVLTASQPFTSALVMSNREWFKYAWVWRKTRPGGFLNAKNRPLKIHEDVCVFSEGTTANRSPALMPYFPQGLRECRITKTNTFHHLNGVVGTRPSRSNRSQWTQSQTGYPVSIISFPSEQGMNRTTKPVALMEYLIRTYTLPGQVVLDNCMGSGTTGVACVNTRRKFIGIELDLNYFEIARRRIAEAEANLKRRSA